MPGNIVIKPLQATFNRDSGALGKMSPYYVVSLGEKRQKGSTCKNGGKNPQWKDAVTVEKTGNAFCTVELRGKRALFPDRNLGACQIPVHELTEEKSSRWYDILYKDKVEGRILIEANLIAGEGELVDKQGIHPLGTKSANAIDDRERREPLEIENRNAVSLAELANNKDGYDIKVIEPPQDGPEEQQRREEPQEQQDVMHVPVIDPSKASIDNMENQVEERKVEVLEEERGAFKDKEVIQDVVQPVIQEVVPQRESVGGDEVDVPEERTEAEGQVKTELKTRERQEM